MYVSISPPLPISCTVVTCDTLVDVVISCFWASAALEYYNASNVYTKDGKLINRIDEGPVNVTYFNQWLDKPAFESAQLHYSAGMMQSWNKFCFQGGLIEVSAKLPGAINNAAPDDVHKIVTTNPNAIGAYWENGQEFKLTPKDVIKDIGFYPTWPGIWLMGNLGRALFTASTMRMWSWTYNECDPDLAPHQIILACNANPGYGLNPHQGRGAPEIDILEGGGAAISSSIQIAPGMPGEYRRTPVQPPEGIYRERRKIRPIEVFPPKDIKSTNHSKLRF
ncbi:hypothetical protein AC1031_001713 [Aphanomyces cochlioides]|nr:hypothetical protein AC1031_001713 [Aphanomyces cochlioides]